MLFCCIMTSQHALFADILAADSILSSAADFAHYGKDWCKNYAANPSLVLLPRSTLEVQAIVRRAIQHKIALVPSGGRTGLSAGATATNAEVVVSMERMNRILG